MRELVHEPMNTRSSLMSCDRRARLEPHVLERPPVAVVLRLGHRRGHAGDHAPGWCPS